MTLTVYTARISYGGADRLDVTARSGITGLGAEFAPSWALLRPYLKLVRSGAMRAGDWLEYSAAYRLEMLESYARHRPVWDALLAREMATLICYCTITPVRPWCHRRLLAAMLVRLGAEDRGER